MSLTPEDSRRSARKDAATTRSQSAESKANGDWIPANESKIGEAKIGNDDIRSSKSVSITHGRTQKNAQQDQPHIIEDEPSSARNTRSARQQELLTAVDISGSCPTARQCSGQRFPMKFLMGHPQPPTPIQTDNSTANGVVNNIIQPKQMKAMDMRFHWLRDRMNQAQFRFHWRPGPTNLADYWTKFHTAAHHKNFRREILTPVKLVEKLFRSGDNLL